ncbi:P-loop containing nucleoside triphosphate hydrolase protein [Ochromonadaceae sp. CCMP2298]|nr:P-loop containing nucleoside triphosphate hydrolase protein [Ochromonadaceae sp. CCMP2298]
MVVMLARALLVALCLLGSSKHLGVAQGETAKEEDPGDFVLYTDIKPANRTDSLHRLRSVPIVRYKFKYDSVQDRKQMGIIGPEAQRFFPESIEVMPSKIFSSKDRSKAATVLTNFPAVDKNVLFMHGLVVVQELIFRFEELQSAIDSGDEAASRLRAELKAIEDKIHKDVSFHAREKEEIARMEAEVAAQLLALEGQRNNDEDLLAQRQLQEEHKILQFESKLARERMERMEELARKNAEETVRMERELAEKRDALSRETSTLLLQLRQEQSDDLETRSLEHEKEKIKLEIAAKAEEQRVVQEMELQRLAAKSRLDSERMLAGIQAVSAQVSAIVTQIFAQPRQVAVLVGIVLGLIALYYVLREGFKVLRQYIQTRLGKPVLVRETSCEWTLLPHFVANWLSKEDFAVSRVRLEQEFESIVLSAADKERVLNLALATRNTKRSGAPYRHVLLHGSPGTGKTLIARRLALSSGMDYAVMSGGDVAPLGEDAVSQLHGLFRWAAKSRKGLLVFIDEAEAFLSSRSFQGGEDSAEVHVRNALNALLYQTGTPSHTFMLVLATNRPQDLDAAVLDRMDVSIPIQHPALPQRLQLVQLYTDLHLTRVAQRSQKRSWLFLFRSDPRTLEDGCMSEETLHRIALATDGFSGREVAKLFIAAQYALYLAPSGVLTVQALLQTVAMKVEEHNMKASGFTSTQPVRVHAQQQQQAQLKHTAQAHHHIPQEYASRGTGGAEAFALPVSAPASTPEPSVAGSDRSARSTRGRAKKQ